MPADIILISPLLDCALTDPRSAEIAPKDPVLHPIGVAHCAELYCHDIPKDDPSVSPLFGNLKDLPKMHIIAGGRDLLSPDGARLTAKLNDLGIENHYHFDADLCHCWPLAPIRESKPVEDYIVSLLK